MYKITPLKHHHIPEIAALEAAAFSAPWDEAALGGELENPLALWLVAEDEGNAAAQTKTGEGETGTVLGYVGSQTCFEEADILNVCTAPAARRRGLARALMLELEARLVPKGVERISLEVRASNDAAIALYEGLGYTQVGLRRGYYEKPREDALIFQKRIVSP